MVRSNYPTLIFIKQKKQGAPIARILGLNESTGDFVLFLDSDDILEKDSSLVGVYGNFDFFSSSSTYNITDEVPRFSNYPLYGVGNEDQILNNLLRGWYIHPCTIVWKKSFLQRNKGFNVDFLINQDVDLLFRAIMVGGKLIGVDGARAMIREHGNERVGVVNKSSLKIDQIYQLRIWFREETVKINKWNQTYANSLSNYCFEIWSLYRKSMPSEVSNFLKLSKLLNPNLKIKGRLSISVLSEFIGSEKAIALRQFFTS